MLFNSERMLFNYSKILILVFGILNVLCVCGFDIKRPPGSFSPKESLPTLRIGKRLAKSSQTAQQAPSFLVALFLEKETFLCNANIISSKHLITAASCVDGLYKKDIYTGVSPNLHGRQLPMFFKEISEIYMNNLYQKRQKWRNVAILKVENGFDIELVTPIAIALDSSMENCELRGWRKTVNAVTSLVEWVVVSDDVANILPLEACKRAFWDSYFISHDTSICVDDTLDIYAKKAPGNSLICNGHLAAFGTLSTRKDDKTYSIFVRLANYKNWIDGILGKVEASENFISDIVLNETDTKDLQRAKRDDEDADESGGEATEAAAGASAEGGKGAQKGFVTYPTKPYKAITFASGASQLTSKLLIIVLIFARLW